MRKKEWQKAIILSERLRLEQVADVDRCVGKVGGKQGVHGERVSMGSRVSEKNLQQFLVRKLHCTNERAYLAAV